MSRKREILIIILLLLFGRIAAQTPNENLQKYWNYRERLRNKFIVIDKNVETPGVNIPAVEIFYNQSKISWGDANSNMSHYLSVLATELWLLKKNNQNYSTTLKELYYAMLALERLDTYSESHLRNNSRTLSPDNSIRNSEYKEVLENDVNGFHIRDDVSQLFWDKYKEHFDVVNFKSVYNSSNKQGLSQDNIYHNFEGLALIAKLVKTENIENVPIEFKNNIITDRLTKLGIRKGYDINFSLWAKDYITRYIKLLQNRKRKRMPWRYFGIKSNWYLQNPVTNIRVKQGNGSDLSICAFFHYGVIEVGMQTIGKNLRTYPGLTQPAQEQYNRLFKHHCVKLNYSHNIFNRMIDILCGPIMRDVDFDDYKLRSLSCIGNTLGNETLHVLRHHRDNYNPYKTGTFPIYEHLPLIYISLHDINKEQEQSNRLINEDIKLYESLLNSAPIEGPTSKNTELWSSTSRCVWPEDLGINNKYNTHYCGLDYMMMHNLYCIVFNRHKQFLNKN